MCVMTRMRNMTQMRRMTRTRRMTRIRAAMAALSSADTAQRERLRRTARAPWALGVVNFAFRTSSAERGRISSMIARAKKVDILLDASGT